MESIIITGGTRGIGKAITLRLLKEGLKVYALYGNRHADAQDLQKQANSQNLEIISLDVTNQKKISQFFKKISLEKDEVIALVNNAGIFYFPEKKNEEEVFKTNVLGTWYMTNAFADYRKDKKLTTVGAVINSGSIAGIHGPTRSEIYAASKSALHRMAEVQAGKYAKEKLLHINTISYGPVETDLLQSIYAPDKIKNFAEQTPTGRLTQLEEVADLVYYLIKNRNFNLVGTNIVFDGGKILSS